MSSSGPLLGWRCPGCGTTLDASADARACACGGLPAAEYDLERAGAWWRTERLQEKARGLWRYAPLLPLPPEERLTLGEGDTPLLPLRRLAKEAGLAELWIKDEGRNPTASFKSRGLSLALAAARRAGAREVAVATAGNAGGACAAYAAAAGLPAHVFVPRATSPVTLAEIRAAGGHLHVTSGTIADAYGALEHAAEKAGPSRRDVSVSKEPHRIEAKRTMAFELAEVFPEGPPRWIVLPTGGGVAVVAHAKAFSELEEMGVLTGPPPRLVAAQSAGCAPLVRALRDDKREPAAWEEPSPTLAEGVRVPRSGLHRRVLTALVAGGGTAAAADEEAIVRALALCARREGVLLCPEGALALAVALDLRRAGTIGPQERVLVYNTASAHKYPAALDAAGRET